MKKRSLRRAGLGGALAALLVLTGCSGTSGPATPNDESSQTEGSGGTIRYGVDSMPVGAGLDPVLGASPMANRLVLAQLYETLLSQDKDGNIIGGVASEWEEVEGTNNYLLTLREDAQYADGSPILPEDVAFSITKTSQRLADQFAAFVGASVTEDGQVLVEFDKPGGPFIPTASAWSGLFIFSKEWYENTEDSERSRTAHGSGPFVLDSWQDGVQINLVKNENYFNADEVKPDGIQWIFAADDTSRFAMLQQGLLDMAEFGDVAVAEQAEAAGFVPGAAPVLSNVQIMMNPVGTPLESVDVRRAISLSLDRQELIDVGLGGHGEITLPIPPGDPRTVLPDAKTPYYTQDVEEAKKLLAKAGHESLSLDLTYAGDMSAAEVPMLEVMKEQMAAAGITLNLKAVEWPALSSILGGAEPPEGLIFLPTIAQSDVSGYFVTVSDSLLNFWGDLPDAKNANAMQRELIATTDPDKRRELTEKLSHEFADQALLFIGGSHPLGYEYYSESVQGYTPDPFMGRIHLKDAWIAD